MIQDFDIFTHPLKLGAQSLIEASAGTGKTTALENLVLRLIIDGVEQDGTLRPMKMSEILLVTFTEAATAELVQRVRENINDSITLLNSDKLDNNSSLNAKIITASLEHGKTKDDICRSLKMALLSFDENSIFTIHGFCQKMLSSFAFESNSRYNLELISDDSPFLQELVNDYWRSRFYDIKTEIEEKILRDQQWSPAVLTNLLRKLQSSPLTEVVCPDNLADIELVRDQMSLSFEEFKDFCAQSDMPEKIQGKISCFIGKAKKALVSALNCYFSFEDILPLAKALDRELLEDNIAKRHSWDVFADNCPPTGKLPFDFNSILEAAEKLRKAVKDYIACLKYDFVRYVRESGILKQKKIDQGVLAFDDLLLDMYQAVMNSNKFRELICNDFPVVMLDEFQDTDPLQFRIFDRIFNNDKAMMIMVGDPKQSIYQFRGADIYSYLQVSGQLSNDKKRTLTKNYRSDESLLKGLNTVFSIDNPFIEKAISYNQAIAGREQANLVIEDNEDEDSKLKIFFSAEAVNKDDAWNLFSEVVCSKIVHILKLAGTFNSEGKPMARFENDGKVEPVRARDIAVLTARNKDALDIYEKLAASGVQATLQQSGNIFSSDEAEELLIFFNAVIQPGNESKIKSALATSLFKLSVSQLDILGRDSGKNLMDDWQELFFTLLMEWQEKGFIQMFFKFFRSDKINIKATLLAQPRGERRLTNLLQLVELLHQQSVSKQLSPTALIYWLHQQIIESEDREEHELRLESDDSAVKIMTVHKSKGLQFPIVFCPNLWQKTFMNSRNKNEKDFFYHFLDEEGNYLQAFEMDTEDGDIENNRVAYRKEALGELIRLAYVALTRAKNYCCFSWFDIASTELSALGYLAENPNQYELETLLRTGKNAKIRRGWEAWRQDNNIEIINIIRQDAEKTTSLSKNIDPPEWKQIPLVRETPGDWGIMSFSAITEGCHQEIEFKPGDDDEETELEPNNVSAVDLFSQTLALGDFPRGPVAGNCLHSVFEKFNFTAVRKHDWRSNKNIEAMIKDELFMSGMIDGEKNTDIFAQSESKRYAQACDMLQNVLTSPLPGYDCNIYLCDLPESARCPEMQFFFPVEKALEAKKINKLLKHISGRKTELPTAALRGFLNGFIDLVFEWQGRYYIIDWKSNDLGNNLDDYCREAMADSMFESYYYLQSAIYLLALHKFLGKRIPGYDFSKHIGGVFYVYLRGVKNDFPGNGIYDIKPDIEIISLLEDIFEEGK